LINQWIEFCASDLHLATISCTYPLYGYIKISPQEETVAKDAAFRLLGILDSYLQNHTFLVGRQITLADIVVSTTVFDLYVLVLTEELCRQFASVTRWFLTIINDSTFNSVVKPTKFHAHGFLANLQSTTKTVIRKVGSKPSEKVEEQFNEEVEEQSTRDFTLNEEDEAVKDPILVDSEGSGGESEGETGDGQGGEGENKPQSKRQQKKLKNQQIVAQHPSSSVVPQPFPRRVTEKDLMEKAIPSNYHAPQPTRNMPHKHPGSPTLPRNLHQPK